MGPFLWHAPNYTLLPNVLIVSRLPCSPSASMFSAGVMFRCLLQGLPKLIQIPAAKVRANGVIVCSLYVQKEPRVLIAFSTHLQLRFPQDNGISLKSKTIMTTLFFLWGKLMLPTCSMYQTPETYTEITLGGKVDDLQERVLHERNNHGLRLPRLLGHLGSK